MSDILIRKATLQDIPFIKKSLITSWVEHAHQNPEILSEERMKKSKIEKYYSDAINNHKAYVFIAEIAKNKVGLISGYKKELASFFKDPNILYIDDIYVVPDYRRKGIAKVLLSKMEKVAKENGIKRIDGRIYEFNKPMQKLLAKMNYYTPYGTWVKILK